MAPPTLRARNLTRSSTVAERLESGHSLWAQFMGLMGRPRLDAGNGLWLPGTNGIHMMFMRFPIDVVFVGKPAADGSRTVVALKRALPRWWGLVPLVRRANGCLELPVGAIDASETQVGDNISIEPLA